MNAGFRLNCHMSNTMQCKQNSTTLHCVVFDVKIHSTVHCSWNVIINSAQYFGELILMIMLTSVALKSLEMEIKRAQYQSHSSLSRNSDREMRF